MSTRFEYTLDYQQVKYNDITLLVKWSHRNQLNYVIFDAPGNFGIRMYKNITYCSIGKTDTVSYECDTSPLIEPFALYLKNVISDNDYKSTEALLQIIEILFETRWDGGGFIDTINELVKEILFAQNESDSLVCIENVKNDCDVIIINKSTAIMVALVGMIAIMMFSVI